MAHLTVMKCVNYNHLHPVDKSELNEASKHDKFGRVLAVKLYDQILDPKLVCVYDLQLFLEANTCRNNAVMYCHDPKYYPTASAKLVASLSTNVPAKRRKSVMPTRTSPPSPSGLSTLLSTSAATVLTPPNTAESEQPTRKKRKKRWSKGTQNSGEVNGDADDGLFSTAAADDEPPAVQRKRQTKWTYNEDADVGVSGGDDEAEREETL